MTNVYGTGKNGKRLWIRTPDKRWIEIPYGARQDSKVRSVNIWNAKLKKWMTPIWGQWIWNLAGSQQQDMDAFDVRLPGRTWRGATTATNSLPFYNPTYINKRSLTPFTGQQPGWIRFFYLRPRVDPNWRIVSLNYRLPVQVPNRTTNYDFQNAVPFWPAVGFYQHGVNSAFGDVHTEPFTVTGGYLTSPIILTNVVSNAVVQEYASSRVNVYQSNFSAMLDLKAIRKRLTDAYSEQGLDFSGQYEPIKNMSIRRIYLHLKINISITQIGNQPIITNGSTFKFYSDIGTVGVAEDVIEPNWPDAGTYSIRHPVSNFPSGQPFRVVHGEDLITTSAPIIDTTGRYTEQQYQVAATATDLIHDMVLVDPGEDNVSFSMEVLDMPFLNPPAIGFYDVTAILTAERISIHYATPGHDTPESVHRWDAIS